MMRAADAAAGLRELADYLEEHAEAFHGTEIYAGATAFPSAAQAPALVLGLPGEWTKTVTETSMELRRPFGDVRLTVYLSRSTAKTPTGRKTVKQVPTAWGETEEDETLWDYDPSLRNAEVAQ